MSSSMSDTSDRTFLIVSRASDVRTFLRVRKESKSFALCSISLAIEAKS